MKNEFGNLLFNLTLHILVLNFSLPCQPKKSCAGKHRKFNLSLIVRMANGLTLDEKYKLKI